MKKITSKEYNIGIIGGAGTIGSTCAFYLGLQNIYNEIYLIDSNEEFARKHVMDLEQALLPLSKTKVKTGDFEAVKKCQIIICAFSSQGEFSSIDELFEKNKKIGMTIAEELKKYVSNDTIIITVTNPVDYFNYTFYKHIGGDRRKYIGFIYNDTWKLKWALSKVLSVDYKDLNVVSIGDHCSKKVGLFNHVYVNNQQIKIKKSQKDEANEIIKNWYKEYNELRPVRMSGWSSAVNLGALVEAITKDKHSIIPCSVIFDVEKDYKNEETSYKNLSIGLPVQIGKSGVEKIIIPHLDKETKREFDEAVTSLTSKLK